MELVNTQKLLARLYTDSELRRRFFENPEAIAVEFGLNRESVQQLAEISQKQVTGFANSLKWKRLGEVRELIPRTAQALGKNLTTLFWKYAETYLPTGIKKHQEDAIAFVDFLGQQTPIEAAWIIDLARYEQARIIAYTRPTCIIFRYFRYAIASNQFNLESNLEQAENTPIRKNTFVLWLRISAKSQLRYWAL